MKNIKDNRDSIGGIHGVDITKHYVKWCPTTCDFKKDNGIDEYIINGFQPKEPFINKNSKIIAIGSCFTQHMISYLNKHGYLTNNGSSKLYFYTAEFINTFALREQIEWINGDIEADQVQWFRGVERIKSKRVYLTESERLKSRKEIENSDVFILNPGIIEIWRDRSTGRVLWRKTLKDKENSSFEISTFEDNKSNIQNIYDTIRKINPNCKVILMSNPITLNATFRNNSVMVSDCVSKSIIRGVIDEFYRCNKSDRLYYWPLYEILLYYSIFVNNLYEDDMRHPNKKAIELVMAYFSKYYLIK